MIHGARPEPVLITNKDKWYLGTASVSAQRRVKKVRDYIGHAETERPLPTREAIWSRAKMDGWTSSAGIIQAACKLYRSLRAFWVLGIIPASASLLELWTLAALFNKKEAVCRICEIWVDLLILWTDNANGSQTTRISSVKSLFSLMWFKRISCIHYYGIRWVIHWEEIVSLVFLVSWHWMFVWIIQ